MASPAVLSAVASKVTNQPINLAAALDPAFKAFLDSITDEQIPKVLSAFTEPQQFFVMQLLGAHRAAKKAPAGTVSHVASGGADAKSAATKTTGTAPVESTGEKTKQVTPPQDPAPADAVPSDSTFRIVMDVLENHEARLHEWMEREGQKMIAEKLAEKAARSGDKRPPEPKKKTKRSTQTKPANDDQ